MHEYIHPEDLILTSSVEDVRVEIYRSFMDECRAPSPAEITSRLRVSTDEVVVALRQLASDDVIAFHPGTEDLWLAHPFCAADGPFDVRVGDLRWSAICVWDSLGILALLESDGRVSTMCPDCGEAIEVVVVDGKVVPLPGSVVHYGVPARRWYEDIGFT